jgi:hypothetical protein
VDVAPAAVAARLERSPERLLADCVRDARDLRVKLDCRPQEILRGRIARTTVTAAVTTVGELERRRASIRPCRSGTFPSTSSSAPSA